MRVLSLFGSLFVVVTTGAISRAGDWTAWRGPTSNGVAVASNLPDSFSIAEPGKDNLIWTAPHGCRSTPLVHEGRVFINSHTGNQRELEQESVVCLDADSGRTLWQYKFNVFYTDIVSNRVGWTNMAVDPASGNVYCHGTQGLLLCLSRDGQLLWERSLTEEFGRVSGYGGRLSGVLLDGQHVIVPINCAVWGKYGRGGTRFIAFHKDTGELVWYGSCGFRVLDSFQSTPVAAEIAGQRLIIGGAGDGGLHAFKASTGEKVWSHLFCLGAVNTDPVVAGNLVYIAHGDVSPEGGNIQGRVLCVDASQVVDGKPKVVWQKDGLKIKFATPVLVDGRLILNDEDGRLYCLDAQTGEEHWRLKVGGGGNVRCSPVWADGKLYVGDSRGRFYIVKDDPQKPARLHQVTLFSTDPVTGNRIDGEIDGAVAVADGRIYFGNGTTLFCIGSGNQPSIAQSPDRDQASPVAAAGQPAFLQVFPGEVTLPPGGTARFTARLFDVHGNYLRDTAASWELAPMEAPEPVVGLPPPPQMNPPPLKGTIDSQGQLTVAEVQGQYGRVVAKAEGLQGSARVRQVPRLPYVQDFSKVPEGAVPGGWTNAAVKFQVREIDGDKLLVKTATNPSPLVARANAFIGPPEWTEYTIQADMLATRVRDLIGDMGINANRYSLFLQGDLQQFRLVSWGGLLRIDRTIAFDWTDQVWYRLKLTVSQQGDNALVRGKIWQRDQPEPEQWTLEVVDHAPNPNGAPGIYARIPPASIVSPQEPGAEIYFDNLSITPNN